MRSFSVLCLLLLLAPTTAQVPASSSRYAALRQEAEARFAEKSFTRAHAAYEEASRLPLDDAQKRWVAFRLADTAWRSTVASPSADPTVIDSARQELEAILRDSGEDHDRTWAEAQESLGDSHWVNPNERNIGAASQYYYAALEWWSGSADLDLARSRYLAIVFRMADPGEQRYYYGYNYPATNVSREVLTNAVAIAKDPAALAHARYLLGTNLLATGTPRDVERALDLLDLVIAAGTTMEDTDDALFIAGQRLSQGVMVLDQATQQWIYRPDYDRALAYFRRLVGNYRQGQTPYYEQATAAIKSITDPSLVVMVAGTFLSTSEQEIVLSSRNVAAVNLSIVPVDLLKDVSTSSDRSLVDRIATAGRNRLRQWTAKPAIAIPHAPVNDRVRIEPKLDRGAYIIEATSGSTSSRALLLVTDNTIIIHQGGQRTDVVVANAISGKPQASVPVRLWRDDGRQHRQAFDAITGSSGLASLTSRDTSGGEILVVSGGASPAYLTTWGGYRPNQGNDWRVYAFTDRPAYRPDETVQWKMIARVRQDEVWSTPAGETLEYEITGPRGEKVASGSAKLNEFGSFSAALPVTPAMALGQYVINLRKAGQGSQYAYAGSSLLFRLEEYKLPEFRVDVSAGDDKGQPRQYRLGDTIEAAIDATYYFGGPVANASVEVVVRRSSYVRYWNWRQYDWYWPQPPEQQGTEIRRETLTTDAAGRAVIRIDTSVDEQESDFTIEARVTDASRREVTGTGSVRVTRLRYSVAAQPQRYIVRPGEKAHIDFKAMDANERPVRVEGSVRVIRRQWEESWSDPAGHEVTGRELEKLRADVTFPPQNGNWRRRYARYRDEEILTTTLTTNAAGEATLSFTPTKDGYYTATWTSEDRRDGDPKTIASRVTAETTFFVSDRTSSELGYRAGALEIILDKESYRTGETAMAMIVTPASGRWAFITTSASDILESQVIQLDGTVKLIPITLDARHAPSFHITASSVFDRMFSSAAKQLVVPPVEKFLDVDVKLDRAQYEPRGNGTVTITTRDVDGKPVAAEVALSVSDESVTAIATDPAGNPRKFFYGDLRPYALQVAASVSGQRYLNLVEYEKELVDEREAASRRLLAKDKKEEGDAASDQNAMADGVVGGMAGAPPPPPAAPAPQAMAEAITVTSNAPRKMAMQSRADGQVAQEAQPIAIDVRSDFRATAFWQPDILTSREGTATVKVQFPESLTTWRATARAANAATQVGMASSTAKTSMPLVVRLQGPRFFVAGDQATISAVMNNNTDKPMRVTPSLDADGVVLGDPATAPAITIEPNGEARADWKVDAKTAGNARLRVTGRSETTGDSMEKTFTVYEHGIDRLVARSGKLRAEEATIRLELPKERRDTTLTVQVQPSIAATMLDALPYLVNFPYGCTEQTMSRFLPAAIVARTLAKNGLSAQDIEGRMFGGIEKQHAGVTNPQGSQHFRQLNAVTDASLARLYDFQHSDGGWGWWKEGSSDPYMTAYVLWGFSIAKEAGIPVRADTVNRAASWLDGQLVKSEDNLHDQAWMLHALAAWSKASGNSSVTEAQNTAFENIWKKRERLTAYSRALFTLAAENLGKHDRALVLVRNLEDGAKIDRAPDKSVLVRGSGANAAETMATAHWGEERSWWRWYDGAIESTAFTLQALMRVDPQSKLVEPAMNWLVKNRRGAQWNNTRDTAISVLALTDYMKASGELSGDVSWEVAVNGTPVGSFRSRNALDGPAKIVVDRALVRESNDIVIRKTGTNTTAPLYFAVEGRFFSLEEPVKASGNEIFVRRDYFKLAPRPTLLKGVMYDRVPLRDGESVKSGERVEVVLTVESKNDYDYLLFEDMKPAGLEAVSLQSGSPVFATELRASAAERKFADGNPPGEQPTVMQRKRAADQTWRSVWTYQELRDRKVALFIDHLPQGTWEIRYTMRAEVPGSFHALPLIGQAMYAPEIRANGEELRIKVIE